MGSGYLLQRGVCLKDGRAGKTEELCLGEEVFDGPVILAKLGPVAFIENEDDPFVSQGFQLLFVSRLVVSFPLLVALAVFVQGEAELLDGGDDDLVGVIVREQPPHESTGVGVFLDAPFLKAVELLAGLPVEILAIHNE